MATTVTFPSSGAIIANLIATLSGAVKVGTTPASKLNTAFSSTLTTGTAINQADVVWFDTRTLAGVTAENIDLTGTLTDSFGSTVSMARAKLLYIYNQNTTAGFNLQVGNAASNAWTTWANTSDSCVLVGPGGLLLLFNPSATAYAVTAGTGDLLKINNPNASAVIYDICVFGASA